MQPLSHTTRDRPVILDGTQAPDANAPPPHGKPCPQCGAPVEAHDHFCPACGTPLESTTTPAVWPNPQTAELPAQQHFECKNCGSEIATELDQRSFTCPFCESNYVIQIPPRARRRRAPEYVIGFAIPPDEASARFATWISQNHWFRPGDLRRSQLADKMKGVYLPFWTFTMLAQSAWNANIGEYWYRTETYTTRDAKGKTVTRTRTIQETEWWPLSGRHHRYYNGYLVSGSRGLSQTEADQIKPFQLPALKRYEPHYLAGWLCEEYSVEHDDALDICQTEFLEREYSNVKSFLPGDTFGGLEIQTSFSRITTDLCLLPVYILTYEYRDQRYRFLINGQTGKVSGQKPISIQRVVIAVAGFFLLIAIMLFVLSQLSVL